MTGAKVDHRIRCRFTRRKKFGDRIFDLDDYYYLLVAKGRADKQGLELITISFLIQYQQICNAILLFGMFSVK